MDVTQLNYDLSKPNLIEGLRNFMNKKFEENENINEPELNSDDETENSILTEDELQEQYNKLPMWQHVLLVILFLFGMAAVVVVIDFIVDFGAELLKRIF